MCCRACGKWCFFVLHIQADNYSSMAANPVSVQPSFTENVGQAPDAFRYYFQGDHHALFLSEKGFLTQSFYPVSDAEEGDLSKSRLDVSHVQSFVGANSQISIMGEGKTDLVQNFFLGDVSVSNASTYESVLYQNVWDGIDVRVYFTDDGVVEYDVIVAPGSDPAVVKFEMDGVVGMRLDTEGNMIVSTEYDEFVHGAPYVYQVVGDERVELSGAYVIEDDFFTYHLGEYNSDLPLIIDPPLSTLDIATYVGGSGHETAVDMEYYNGYYYFLGHSDNSSFPTTNGVYQTTVAGGRDAVIYKMDPSFDTDSLLISTFYGGSGTETLLDLFVDASGVYIAGDTNSGVPTTAGAIQTSYGTGGSNGFIAKFSSDLVTLSAATMISGDGSHPHGVYSILVDSGNIYVAGYLAGDLVGGLPVGDFYDEDASGSTSQDGFIAQIDSAFENWVKFTYVGGDAAYDNITQMRMHGGDLYIVGITGGSSDFPTTTNAYSTTGNGGTDAFIARFDPGLGTSSLEKSTFLGGSAYDALYSIMFSDSDLYVLGFTQSSDFPTTDGVFQSSHGGGTYDGVVVRMDQDLTGSSALVASSYYGGAGDDYLKYGAIGAIDSGKLYFSTYFTPSGSSGMSIPSGGYDTSHNGGNDGSVAMIDLDLTTIEKFTYFGTALNDDSKGGIYIEDDGDVIVHGSVGASYTATSGAYSESYNGGTSDIFIAVFGGADPVETPEFSTVVYVLTLILCGAVMWRYSVVRRAVV